MKTWLKVGAVVVGTAVIILLPFVVSDFRSVELAKVGVFFIAILGLDILTGYSGQISLGHVAFMAVGGYTTGILTAHHGVRYLWTLPVAALVTGAIGLLFGIPALRLSGLYLALATFGIAVALPSILKKFDHFTGCTRSRGRSPSRSSSWRGGCSRAASAARCARCATASSRRRPRASIGLDTRCSRSASRPPMPGSRARSTA
jgi:ABC-type branched-subunit amino acid transport system permease subunit